MTIGNEVSDFISLVEKTKVGAENVGLVTTILHRIYNTGYRAKFKDPEKILKS